MSILSGFSDFLTGFGPGGFGWRSQGHPPELFDSIAENPELQRELDRMIVENLIAAMKDRHEDLWSYRRVSEIITPVGTDVRINVAELAQYVRTDSYLRSVVEDWVELENRKEDAEDWLAELPKKLHMIYSEENLKADAVLLNVWAEVVREVPKEKYPSLLLLLADKASEGIAMHESNPETTTAEMRSMHGNQAHS